MGGSGIVNQPAATSARGGFSQAMGRAGQAAKDTAANAGIGVTAQAATGDIDELSDIPKAAMQGVVGGLAPGSIGRAVKKFGLNKEQQDALKKLVVDTPIGRMGISQLAKKLGVSGTKAAAIWYMLHPASRRGLSRAAAALAGAQD
jgi:hypothetical protein